VLVTEHGVPMLDLAAALSEQHGLAIGADAAAKPGTSRFPDESFYEVKEPGDAALFSTDSFLEATDFAFEYFAAEAPDVLEIVRQRGNERSACGGATTAANRSSATARSGRTASIRTPGRGRASPATSLRSTWSPLVTGSGHSRGSAGSASHCPR
jgi:hypothetical protein